MRNQIHEEVEKVFEVSCQMLHFHEFMLTEYGVIRPAKHTIVAKSGKTTSHHPLASQASVITENTRCG